MGRHILHGNPQIEVTLRRSPRAKRLSLRVSRLDGRITLTLPQRAPDREGIAFLRQREEWLRGHLAQIAPVHDVSRTMTVLFEGQQLPIITDDVARAQLQAGALLVPRLANVGATAQALLKQTARNKLAAASDEYAAALDLSYSRLSTRDTRSRWGSCSTQGVLMYSWRLIMAPPAVLRYVAAHEVAHLAEMNHSPAFWAVVAQLFPDYADCRNWLRDNGDQLHRVSFVD